MQLNLFEQEIHKVQITKGAFLLKNSATKYENKILNFLKNIIMKSPLRVMYTPNGLKMSVSMTNCGLYGWVSDYKGYRYLTNDPLTKDLWPPMPNELIELATNLAEKAGYNNFLPNSCLVNYYNIGSKMGLHQDKDEKDIISPIVSVSLGLPSVFLFGGTHRRDSIKKIELVHGDSIVWGGEARLAYHGIQPIKPGIHPLFNNQRVNLTFRKACLN